MCISDNQNQFLNHLDIYEVDKQDAESYCYRLKTRPQMKKTPTANLEVYVDIETRQWLWGIETTDIMGQKARRYFIFEFLDDELLGPHRTVKKITLEADVFEEFIKRCMGEHKEKEGND